MMQLSNHTNTDGNPLQTRDKMVEYFSQVVSVLFHPIFLIVYFLVILLLVNPYSFAVQNQRELGIIIIYVVVISILFPVIPILMMKTLGFTSSMTLSKQQERTLPLVVTGVFYLWLFINMYNNNVIPVMFTSFLLGATITLFTCFFINLFTKISLHAAGISGFVTGLFVMNIHSAYKYFGFSFGGDFTYQININLIIIFFIVVAGLVGTSRLLLKAHTLQDVYTGYFVGFLAQLVAMRFILY